MALIFMDGFDKYGPPGQASPSLISLMTAGEWSSVTTSSAFPVVAGLSGTGQAVSVGNNGSQMTRNLNGNYSRLIGGVRFSSTLGSGVCGVSFLDGASAQFSIVVASTGAITARTGNIGGTVLATSVGTISPNSTHYLEWDVTFGASANYQIWLDGVSILNGTGATRTTANNSSSAIQFSTSAAGTTIVITVDDLYVFDTTGATCNAVLLTNPIVETQFPTGDAQAQWTAGATIIGQDYSATASTNAPGANQIFLRAFTPSVNMTLNSISIRPAATSATAKFKPAVYGPVASGGPGAHRYWRLMCNASLGAPFTIAEIQFRSVAGTSLAFSGGTATGFPGSASPGSAADGNASTFWTATSGAAGQWWQYDYGAGNTFTVAEVAITARNDTFFNQTPTSIELQYSDDGLLWNGVFAMSSATWTIGQTQTFAVASRSTSTGSVGSALLATGSEIVGTTSGATLTAPLSAGVSLTAGVVYAIGCITDTSVVLSQVDVTNNGLRALNGNTYTTGVPLASPTLQSSQPSWQLWGNCMGAAANWASLANNPPIDDIAYVTSSTVNQEDLYSFPALSSAPAAVHAVAVKARVKRSDSGARTVDVRLASAGIDSAGSASGFVPGTSFGWVDSYFPLDPATGIAWTGSGVNGLTAGIKVAS